MSEISRLIENGFITQDFLKEEIICDYRVTEQFKKIWAIELDLLEEFKRVCKKHNLTYYAYAGTLLGAVRHKDFIPWDDDIDVCMPRRDYDLLTKVYADEFKAPYFMQTPYTDNEYAFSFAKIRNVNTCFASAAFIESPMNQGVFLDVFALDESSKEGAYDRREKTMGILRKCSAFMSRNNKFTKNKHTEYAKELEFKDNDSIKFYEEIQKIPTDNTHKKDYLAIEICTMGLPENNMWPREFYGKGVEIPFCNTKINVPTEYEKVLKISYKNYMEFPPVELRGMNHSNVIIDADRPFCIVRKEYIESKSKG